MSFKVKAFASFVLTAFLLFEFARSSLDVDYVIIIESFLGSVIFLAIFSLFLPKISEVLARRKEF